MTRGQMHTGVWTHEDALCGRQLLDGLLAVDRAVGQDHGRVVLVHDLARERAHQLTVHVLGPWQTLRQVLERLRASKNKD
jgi:hypothetical protein